LRRGLLSCKSRASQIGAGRNGMEKEELLKLRAFLRQALGAEGINVVAHPRDSDQAEVRLGEKRIGKISVDDEDGDRSFALEIPVPVAREALQSYLKKLFENDKLRIAGRLKKTDSVELSNGDEFLGVLSADDPKGASWTFQMAILDFDLEDF
jgi:hypothetical protein